MQLRLPNYYFTSTPLRKLWLLLSLLGLSPAAHAASYYWVGNSGTWSELSHWASTSGGAGNAYSIVPKSTDDVYFDAKSFTLTNRRVTIVGTVACNNLTWSGAVQQASFTQGTNGLLEINGNLRYTPSMATAAIGVPHRMLATTDVVVDTQGVPLGGTFTFDSASGGWTFTSAFIGVTGLTVNISAARLVSFGSAALTFSTLNTYAGSTTTASTVAGTLDLGSSTTTLLAQTNVASVNLLNPNLTLTAGTSTLNVGAGLLSNYGTPVGFTTVKALAFNRVVVNAGQGAAFAIANSSFNTLLVNSRAILSSAATIAANGSLTLGTDATLLVGAGTTRVLSFGSGATLATSGSCAGFGTVQSTQLGSPAILTRVGGWASNPLSYAVLQDLTFSSVSSGSNTSYPANGAAVATASADQGGNSGVTISSPPVTDLYWVGNGGNWHDPSHWASTSGGTPGANTCVPNVFTNVKFDANSFTATGAVVLLDQAGQQCRNMSWTGAANRPTLSAAAKRTLTVAGSLTLLAPAQMTQTLEIDVFLGQPQGGGAYTLTTAGQSLAANLWFRPAGGSYSLLDDVTTAGRVFVESGTFNTNNYTVAAQGFTSGYAFNTSVYTTGTSQSSPVSLSPPTVNLGTSVLNLLGTPSRSDTGVGVANYAWDVASVTTGNVVTTPVTLSAATSTINLLNGNNLATYYSYFRGGLGVTYGTVTVANNTAVGAFTPTVFGAGTTTSTFQNLRFYGPATIGSNNIIRGQLLLSPGKTYSFTNANTQTFNSGATLTAQGTCANFITVGGTSQVRFVSASNVPLQYVILQNTVFSGGATWQDQGGIDNGSNVGIAISSPPTRTLYWVGEGGNWSDAAHWSLSSGGAGGECSPALVDNVIIDANSVKTTGQTLTLDLTSSNCRSIDCSAAANGLTLRSAAGNVLNVYGSVTWAPTPSMTLVLAGGLSLLGTSTASILTSAGQTLSGTLTLNVPSGSVSLADDFLSTAAITHLAGTFTTNDRTITALSYGTSGSTAKALRLGASQVTVNGTWGAQTSTGLTVTPGTSLLTVSSTSFTGGNQPYNDVVIKSASGTISVSSNNTFRNLQLAGRTNVLGSNTINGVLTFSPGQTYVFTAGTTTTFGTSATLVAVGSSTSPITLQSSLNGSLFTWTKASGGICADYTFIRDSQATGGAYFEAGRNGANNQGNNPGWSFGFVPRASYASRTTCPAEGAHVLRLDFTAYDGTNNVSGLALTSAQYPISVRIRNLTTGTEEVVSASTTPYYYPIASSTTTAQYQVISVTTAANACGSASTTDLSTFPVVTDAILAGPTGTWSGNSTTATGSWLDCQNWASGAVPTSTTDVTISQNATSVSLGNSQTVSVPVQPTLNGAGATVRTLTIPAGATLALGSSAQLAVFGDWANRGTVTAEAASLVTFQGTSPQTLTGGNFGSVVVNNAAGLLLATEAGTSGSLVFAAGTITTGSSKWIHRNGLAASLSGYGASSYVVGTLRRAIASSATATYAFPVGTASQYALYELLDKNLSGTGFSSLDAKFGFKPGTDDNLNYTEPNTTSRYRAVNSAGVWTLTPSAQPTAGTYDAKVSLAPFRGLTDNYFAILKRPDASTDAFDWTSGGGTLNADGGAGRRVADGYALRLGLSSFSQFGLGQSQAAVPLPLTLASFRATASGLCGVRLDWATASEVQSDRFEVERSPDGRSFAAITTVASRNSPSGSAYTYTDQYPGEGLNYYRLRLVDRDRTSTYSPVVTLRSACAPGPVTLVPNPATSNVRLLGLRPGQTLRVYASDGRVVYTNSATEPDQPLEISSWATGLYLVHVRNADGTLAGTHKLVKQ